MVAPICGTLGKGSSCLGNAGCCQTHKCVYTSCIFVSWAFPFQVEILFSDSVLTHPSSNFPDRRKKSTGDGCHARSVLVMFMSLLVASYDPLCDMIMFSSGHSLNKNKPTNSSNFPSVPSNN